VLAAHRVSHCLVIPFGCCIPLTLSVRRPAFLNPRHTAGTCKPTPSCPPYPLPCPQQATCSMIGCLSHAGLRAAPRALAGLLSHVQRTRHKVLKHSCARLKAPAGETSRDSLLQASSSAVMRINSVAGP
jgi:hypothetical protein